MRCEVPLPRPRGAKCRLWGSLGPRWPNPVANKPLADTGSEVAREFFGQVGLRPGGLGQFWGSQTSTLTWRLSGSPVIQKRHFGLGSLPYSSFIAGEQQGVDSLISPERFCP